MQNQNLYLKYRLTNYFLLTANMATLKEAIRLWTSPCVIEQTFARQLSSTVVTDRISSSNTPSSSSSLRTKPIITTSTCGSMTAMELIDLRTCEAVHRAQGRLRQAIAQYHKLLVVYFSLYLELFHFESANTKAKYLEMTHNIESINALKRISCYYVEQALCTSRNKFARALYGSKVVRDIVPLASEYSRNSEMLARAAAEEFTPPDGPETEEAKSRCFRSIIESLIVLQQDIPVEWQAVDKSGAIHVLNYLLESLLCSIHSAFESRLKAELLQRGIVGRRALQDALDAVEEEEGGNVDGDDEDDEDDEEVSSYDDDDEEEGDDYDEEEENDDEDEDYKYKGKNGKLKPVKLSYVNHFGVEVMEDEVEVEVELDLERTFLGDVGLCGSSLSGFGLDDHVTFGDAISVGGSIPQFDTMLEQIKNGLEDTNFDTMCSNKIRDIIADRLKQPPMQLQSVSSITSSSVSPPVSYSENISTSINNSFSKKGK